MEHEDIAFEEKTQTLIAVLTGSMEQNSLMMNHQGVVGAMLGVATVPSPQGMK